MSRGTTKKDWFKKVFGGSEDPNKALYKSTLNLLSPAIKQASKLPAYKSVMAGGLKEVDQLVKAKRYTEAVAKLESLGRQAEMALAPSLTTGTDDNTLQELQSIAGELVNVVTKAKSGRVSLAGPTLEEEETVVLREIENKNAFAARNYLEALKSRIEEYENQRTTIQQALAKVQQDAEKHGVGLPPELASLEGVQGLIGAGRFQQAQSIIQQLSTEVSRGIAVARDLDDLHGRAGVLNLGTKTELSDLHNSVAGELRAGRYDLANAALGAYQQFFDDQSKRIDRLLEEFSGLLEVVKAHKLTLKPDATTQDKAIRDLLRQGKIGDAESAVKSLRASFKPAAELHRLRDLLDRLYTEENGQGRIDQTLLDNQHQLALKHLEAGDANQAQVAIKKISDAIADYKATLSPDVREKAELERTQQKFEKRLKKAQQLARSKGGEEAQRLVNEMAKLSPLARENEAKAAELYTQILLLSGGSELKKLGGSANSVFVLKSPDRLDVDGSKSKQFFKPVSGESSQLGFPGGGGACREVVGKALGDKISAMTGLNIDVAETNLVELPPSVLPPELAKSGPAIGSLQHNVHHKGDAEQRTLRSLSPQERTELYAKIPKKKAQSQQVYDLIFANLDRHDENIFVKGEGEEAELSGIDNGMGLPSKQGLLMRGEAFGLHALAGMPANDDKLDPEVLQALDKLDPDELAKTAKESFQAMQKQFPGSEATSDDKLNDEHLELMKSSVRFLKKAAKELTVNELFNAYQVGLQDVYGFGDIDTKLTEDERFDKLIEEAKQRGPALAELKQNKNTILKELDKHGWALNNPRGRGININDVLTQYYPRQVVAIWKAATGGQQVPRGPMPVGVPDPPPAKALDSYSPGEIDDCAKATGTKASDVGVEDMRYWSEYVKLGGDAKLQRLGGAPSASFLFNGAKGRYEYLVRLIEFQKEFAKVQV